MGHAGWQLITFGARSLQDKWVLNHEDVLLGERIGRVSQNALALVSTGQGCPRGSPGVASGHATACWASALVSLGRVTLGRCSVAA